MQKKWWIIVVSVLVLLLIIFGVSNMTGRATYELRSAEKYSNLQKYNQFALASGSNYSVCQNFACVVVLGEGNSTCYSDQDCSCGNGVCETWENDSSSSNYCPQDCAVPTPGPGGGGGGGIGNSTNQTNNTGYCGDGICNGYIGESVFTCSLDCGNGTGGDGGNSTGGNETNGTIVCYSNDDCPQTTNNYCSGSSACSSVQNYICQFPGTQQSECKPFSGGAGCGACPNGCFEGSCIPGNNETEFCGDGVCSGNETMASCFVDCGHDGNSTYNACNLNGQCIVIDGVGHDTCQTNSDCSELFKKKSVVARFFDLFRFERPER